MLLPSNGEKIIMVTDLTKTAFPFRLSERGPTMGHDEPGQVGNQAALSHHFHVSDSASGDGFFHLGMRRVTGGVPGT